MSNESIKTIQVLQLVYFTMDKKREQLSIIVKLSLTRLSKVFLLGLLIPVFASACKGDNKVKIISSREGKLWDLYRPQDTIPVGIYQFYSDGKLRYYLYSSTKEINEFSGYGDLLVCNCWELKSDSILYIQGIDRKIIFLSNDIIVLSSIVTLEKRVLIKSNAKLPNQEKRPDIEFYTK